MNCKFWVIRTQSSWMWSAQKVNHFQGSTLGVVAVNLAKIHKLLFEISWLHKWLHTDTTKYTSSRPPPPDGWQLIIIRKHSKGANHHQGWHVWWHVRGYLILGFPNPNMRENVTHAGLVTPWNRPSASQKTNTTHHHPDSSKLATYWLRRYVIGYQSQTYK